VVSRRRRGVAAVGVRLDAGPAWLCARERGPL